MGQGLPLLAYDPVVFLLQTLVGLFAAFLHCLWFSGQARMQALRVEESGTL